MSTARTPILIVLLLVFFGNAQNNYAQDLVQWRETFAQGQIAKDQLKAAINLGKYYNIRSFDSSYFFGTKAYELASTLQDQNGMAEASVLIAHALDLGQEEFHEAINWAKKGLRHLNQDCSPNIRKRLIPNVYIAIAITYKQLEMFDSATYYLNLADEKLVLFNRKNERWAINKTRASFYLDLEEYEQASNEAEKAWTGMLSSGLEENKAQKGFILFLLANTSLLAGNTELYASSIEHMQSIQRSPKPWDLEAQTPTHISLANLIEKKDVSTTLEKVVDDAEKREKFFFAGLHASTLGVTYQEQGNIEGAIEAFERAKKSYKKVNMSGKVWQSQRMLYQLYKQLGHTEKAFHSLESASNLRDSLKQEESRMRMAELEVKYDTEKKSTALVQRTRERNQWLISSVVLLIFAAGIFILFQSRLRLQRLFSEQKEREAQQDLHLASYNAMVEGQEQERKRIAQELHDGVGGALASLKSYSHVRANKPKLAEEATIKTDRLIDDISVEVRRISQDLMPVSLERLGLKAALADIVAQLNDHGTDTQLEYFGNDARLDDQQKLMLYRIVQELCNNIRKHADASKALIQLVIEQDQINLLVEDDGQGFQWEDVKEKKSLGLKTLEARVALLGGNFEVDARPGTGTSVNIEVKG